jgi:sucrose-phosphate synthase
MNKMKTRDKKEGLYILMLSIHGLVRAKNLELGRDADTGGQVKYVIELARKLAQDRRIARVDLLTRKVISKNVDPIYAHDEEKISAKASIFRLQCGPRRYLRKEVLWPYLDSYSDQAVQHIRRIGHIPDLIHGHYADAGYVGGQLARLLGVPFVFTGHSLGRVKLERLLNQGMKKQEIEQRYNITRRIDAEEFALDTAVQVVASTHQEIEEQYKLYEHYDPKRMAVIPPGIDLEKFFPPRRVTSRPPILKEVERFLVNPRKPIVFAMSRADEKKNIETLIHAFGKNSYLKKNANLLIIAGNRDDIRTLDSGARRVLSNILYLVDKYDLYGQVAYPKTHNPDDVPELYRIATKTKGVFVNPALTEPFGLTLLEAAASGLPLVATNDGGPQDIIGYCKNGELVDPNDEKKMGQLIQQIIDDKKLWCKYSTNGIKYVRQYYAWRSHVKSYITKTRTFIGGKYYKINMLTKTKSRLATVDRLIISDIDHTLVGDTDGLRKLVDTLRQHTNIGFGIATGRRLESAVQILKKSKFPIPDILITAVGSEINYGKSLVEDRTWKHHLNYFWQPELIRQVLDSLPGLKLQEDSEQRKYKISYYVNVKKAPKRSEIVRKLRQNKLRVKVIHSHDKYLDILPIRASKGLAVRYLAIKWGLPLDHILVAGDSGNDEEMLSGDMLGVVVGNYSPELKRLQGKPRVYFANDTYAKGILEGINHYNFFNQIKIEEEEYKEEEESFETTTG